MTDLVPAPIHPPAVVERTGPVAHQWVELLKPAADLANAIARTEFVPPEMRNKIEAVTACILYGDEIGIGPMMALSKVDIVKGRPAPRAELARALALAAGHEIWVQESTNTKVTVAGQRRGSSHVQTVTWTMDDAKRAGIASGTYQKYPRQMLLARASAELVRMLCPEVLGGITVFAEEAADIDVASDTPATTTEAGGSTSTTRTRQRRTRETAPAEPAAPVEVPGITDAQLQNLVVSMKDAGVSERDDKIRLIRVIVERAVDSSKELTRDEASTVIDVLERIRTGELEMSMDADGAFVVRPVDSSADADTSDDGDEPPLPED